MYMDELKVDTNKIRAPLARSMRALNGGISKQQALLSLANPLGFSLPESS